MYGLRVAENSLVVIHFCIVHTMVKSEKAAMETNLTYRGKVGRGHGRIAFKNLRSCENRGRIAEIKTLANCFEHSL